METNDSKICHEITKNTIEFITGEFNLNFSKVTEKSEAIIIHNIIVNISSYLIANLSSYTDLSPIEFFHEADIGKAILNNLEAYDKEHMERMKDEQRS